MMLKNQMEEKQLNIHRPLLSVRRTPSKLIQPETHKKKINNDSHPSLPPLPYYKSDLKSGPVRNPGVIPFQWEMSPGRPKNNRNQSQMEEDALKHQLPPTPKLPPGRLIFNQNEQQKPGEKEQKDSPASSSRSNSETLELSSWEKAISVLQEPEEGVKNEDTCSSEDENVVYEDARDKLSRTDSFFLNCSVSGVTGMDDSIADSFEGCLDPRARDFMMGRFLPAAKAVASETPQFAPEEYDGRDLLKETMGSPRFLWRQRASLGLSRVPRTLYGKGGARIISSPNRVTEKTVRLLDSEQMVIESCSSSSSSLESRGRNSSVDYSLQDSKSLCGDDHERTISHPWSSEKIDSSILSSAKKLTENVREDNKNKFRSNGEPEKDMIKKQYLKADQKDGTSPVDESPPGLAPFLPKSPSESWLTRTLPSISSKNPASKLSSGHSLFRPSPVDPKQERMLKSSIVKQHMFLHPLGELAPILEDR